MHQHLQTIVSMSVGCWWLVLIVRQMHSGRWSRHCVQEYLQQYLAGLPILIRMRCAVCSWLLKRVCAGSGIFRHTRFAASASPAALRIQLEPDAGETLLHILRNRYGPVGSLSVQC